MKLSPTLNHLQLQTNSQQQPTNQLNDAMAEKSKLQSSDIKVGDFVVVKYDLEGKTAAYKYYAGVVCVLLDDSQFQIQFLKCKNRKYFVMDDKDVDEVGCECIIEKLDEPAINQKGMYRIVCDNYNLE